MMDNEISFKIFKNGRITREVFKIKNKIHNGSRARIHFEPESGKGYRGEQCLFNIFNIHSLDKTPLGHKLGKTETPNMHSDRRRTQPNLGTEPSLGKDEINRESLLAHLENKSVGEEVNLQPRKSKYKFKELVPLQNTNKMLLRRNRKFKVPFKTFYYRDFLWKVNFTNLLQVEPPLEYEHRLKVYVGKGNNSCMVRGLINRRYWFAVTDRI